MTDPQHFLASQNRSYDVFVRNTKSKPNADPTTEWTDEGNVVVYRWVLYSNTTKEVHNATTKIYNFVLCNILDDGRLDIHSSQSLVEYLTGPIIDMCNEILLILFLRCLAF